MPRALSMHSEPNVHYGLPEMKRVQVNPSKVTNAPWGTPLLVGNTV